MTTPSSIDAFKTLNQKALEFNKDGIGGLNKAEKEAFLNAVMAEGGTQGNDTVVTFDPETYEEKETIINKGDLKFNPKDVHEFVKTYNREGGTIDREDMLKWTQGYNYRNNQSPYGLAETEIEYGADKHGAGPASQRAQEEREAPPSSDEGVIYEYYDQNGNRLAGPPKGTPSAQQPNVPVVRTSNRSSDQFYSEDYQPPQTDTTPERKGLFNGKLKAWVRENPEATAGIATGLGLLGGYGLAQIGRQRRYNNAFEDGAQYAQANQEPDIYNFNFYNRRQNQYYDWSRYNQNNWYSGNNYNNCWWS